LPVRRSATTSKETFCPSLRCSCGAFDGTDMNENVLTAAFRLNKAEAFWPLNHFTVPMLMEISLLTNGLHMEPALENSRHCPGSSIWEKCLKQARLSVQAKRHSRSAKYRFLTYGVKWVDVNSRPPAGKIRRHRARCFGGTALNQSYQNVSRETFWYDWAVNLTSPHTSRG